MKSKRVAKAQEQAQKDEKRLARKTGTGWTPVPALAKTAMMRGFLEELSAIEGVKLAELGALERLKGQAQQFKGQVKQKLDEPVSAREAMGAVGRLKELEGEKVTPGEAARAALAGGAAGMTGAAVRETVAGKPFKAIGEVAKTPGVGKKILGLGKALGKGVHGMAGTALGSAALVTAAPFIRSHLHREAEKEKLRSFLGTSPHKKERGAVKRFLGV